MNGMTLPSRHRKRNWSPGGLRPSTLPLGYGGSPQYSIFTSVWGRNILVFFKLKGESGARTRDLWLSKQADLTTAPGPPPRLNKRAQNDKTGEKISLYAEYKSFRKKQHLKLENRKNIVMEICSVKMRSSIPSSGRHWNKCFRRGNPL